jgi:acyl-CoA dehydrogenase
MYEAPIADIAFALKHVAGLGPALADGVFPGLSDDLVDAVLEEAGRFASERLAPINRPGDLEGARLLDGAVTTAPGWRDAYRDWVAGGWNGIAAPEALGGQGLPILLSAATQEMWNGACMAFALCPMLTMGAVEALARHGSEPLKAAWLPRIISGEWTATMNLTEPQAGSDLGALTTRAVPQPDGTYRLFGQKIFITYGEHDLAGNIGHLVLARLPDAPPGSKGISLFLVPKFLLNESGEPGTRNDVFCASLEHKLGIHASPTCTMIYGDGRFGAEPGAIGWLVGEPNRGLACMFTMMNNARLMVGVQGVGMAERALQQASAYAMQRRQGRAPGWAGPGMSPIVEHPDVRRMLMTMQALTAASRAIVYSCAFASDMGSLGGSPGRTRPPPAPSPGRTLTSAIGVPTTPEGWRARAELLTPVAKAFATDAAFEVASLGVQVFGGAGFIEESGAAQTLRDSRISMIYEGTNGIQAIDLVTRKLPLENGAVVREFINELKAIAYEAEAVNEPSFGHMGERLSAALSDLESATGHILAELESGNAANTLAGASPYLNLFGLAAGGALLAKGALAARALDQHGPRADMAAAGRRPRAARFLAVARFFAERLAPQTAALRIAITDGAESLISADSSLFEAR